MDRRRDPKMWMSVDRALSLFQNQQVDACWEWPGLIGPNGYGVVYALGKQRRAHRVIFERLKGRIRGGLELDHLCRNRRCCNPAHLEAVTHATNCLRGNGLPARNALKTHCAHGHPFDAANTRFYRRKNGVMMRVCRQCNLEDTWRRRGKLASH